MDLLLASLSLAFIVTAIVAAIRIERTLPTGPVVPRSRGVAGEPSRQPALHPAGGESQATAA